MGVVNVNAVDTERERECRFAVLIRLVQCEMERGRAETQAGRVSKQASGFKFVTNPFLLSVMFLLGSFLKKHATTIF